MVFVAISKQGINECYQGGLVKPNEFRQICLNKIEQELSLMKERLTLKQKCSMFISWLRNENWFLSYFQELSDSTDDLFDCIIEVSASKPHLLNINEEEAKLLFLSSIFYKKSLLVRECSDLFNHPLTNSETILVNKETLRAIDYLKKYVNGGRAVLKTLQEDE